MSGQQESGYSKQQVVESSQRVSFQHKSESGSSKSEHLSMDSSVAQLSNYNQEPSNKVTKSGSSKNKQDENEQKLSEEASKHLQQDLRKQLEAVEKPISKAVLASAPIENAQELSKAAVPLPQDTVAVSSNNSAPKPQQSAEFKQLFKSATLVWLPGQDPTQQLTDKYKQEYEEGIIKVFFEGIVDLETAFMGSVQVRYKTASFLLDLQQAAVKDWTHYRVLDEANRAVSHFFIKKKDRGSNFLPLVIEAIANGSSQMKLPCKTESYISPENKLLSWLIPDSGITVRDVATLLFVAAASSVLYALARALL